MLAVPDWTKVYRIPADIEKNLNKFKYKGVGWYLTENDTLLVSQHNTGNSWTYYVQVWNNPTARRELATCLAMPIRKTEGEV